MCKRSDDSKSHVLLQAEEVWSILQGLHELCAPFIWLYRTNDDERKEEDDVFENEATMFKAFYAFVT